MNKKQKKIIKLLEYFSQGVVFKKAPITDGISAEEAFFLFTDQGITDKIADRNRFNRLMYGHKMLSLHEKMWREDFANGLLSLKDFENEPEEVKELAEKIYRRSEHNE